MSRPSAHLLLMIASFLLQGISSVLLWQHADMVSALQSSTLPLVQGIPVLERKEKLLKEQVALSETEASLKDTSSTEYISAFVLPPSLDLDRLLGFFDLLRDDFSKRKLLKDMSAIEVGDATEIEETFNQKSTFRPHSGQEINNQKLSVRPITFSLTLTEEGLSEFLGLLKLTGVFTVADAFRADQIATLLDYTSREHPTAIVSLEQFLETPLAEYAREPRHYEDRLLRSATSEDFLFTFESIRDASSLPAVEKLFQSDVGKGILKRGLWPMAFLMMDDVTVEPVGGSDVKVSLKVLTYERNR